MTQLWPAITSSPHAILEVLLEVAKARGGPHQLGFGLLQDSGLVEFIDDELRGIEAERAIKMKPLTEAIDAVRKEYSKKKADLIEAATKRSKA